MQTPFDRIAAVLDSDLPKHERWVLVVYARWCINGTSAWPSTERICEESGLSERAVRSAVRELERLGHLRFAHYSRVGTKEYLVYLPAPRAASRHPVPPTGTADRPDRHPVPPRPAPRAAETGRRREKEGETPPTPSSRGGSRLDRLVEALAKGVEEQGYVPTWWLDPSPHDLDVMVESCRQHGLTGDRAKIREAMRLVALEA